MAERQEHAKLAIPEGSIGKIGIVRAEFNPKITQAQLDAATALLDTYGIEYEVFSVPGAYELPFVLQRLARRNEYDGLLALGCLIKGKSIHFEVICYSVGKAVLDISLEHDIPVGFGVITAMDREQAEARTWIGDDAAYAVLSSLIQVAE